MDQEFLCVKINWQDILKMKKNTNNITYLLYH